MGRSGRRLSQLALGAFYAEKFSKMEVPRGQEDGNLRGLEVELGKNGAYRTL